MRNMLTLVALTAFVAVVSELLQNASLAGSVWVGVYCIGVLVYGWFAWKEVRSVPLFDTAANPQALAGADRAPELEAALETAGYRPWAVFETRLPPRSRYHVWWVSPDGRTAAEVSVLGGVPHLCLESCEEGGLFRTTAFAQPLMPAGAQAGRTRRCVEGNDVATLLAAHAVHVGGGALVPMDRALLLGFGRRSARSVIAATQALMAVMLALMGGLTGFALGAADRVPLPPYFAAMIPAFGALGAFVLYQREVVLLLLAVFGLRLRTPAATRLSGLDASAGGEAIVLPLAVAQVEVPAAPAPPTPPRHLLVGALVLIVLLLGGMAIWTLPRRLFEP